MIPIRFSSILKLTVICGFLWSVGSAPVGCAWLGGKGKPDWVDGSSVHYPSGQYLIGVGQADSRAGAADQAYAAVAKIFHAQVEAQARDWESYLVIERRDASNAERKLQIENLTKVSTDKVLENVSVPDGWYDQRTGIHYVLAVMNRQQAEASLMEKMATLDRSIAVDVAEARQTTDKLAKVQALRRSTKNVIVREAYNADLRVIRSSGQGTPSVYQVHELSGELQQFLAKNLGIEVQVSGNYAEPVERALMEGLIREGFRVSNKDDHRDADYLDISIRGVVRLFPITVLDPSFKYVRWCGDVEVFETAQQRVVGVVTRGGKVGHLTEQEATAKAIREMQHEFSSDVAQAISAHLFGEVALPVTAMMPSGCPRSDSPMKAQ